MKQQDLKYKIALTLLQGIGPRKASLLLAKMGSSEAVFLENLSVIHRETGISRELLRSLKREEALENGEKYAEYVVRHGLNSHFFLDANYPRRLRQIADAPIMLYSKGNIEMNAARTVAVVGTRSATSYGRALCEELILSLKEHEVQIVSGMAYGIDICAHNACVRNELPTVGVLGHGLDRIYPRQHSKTAEMMLEKGGLLTEFLPGTKPDRENFPMRNRIVAGMTDATIVIESKVTGGSLITADLAFDYDREVFAYPGNVGQTHSEGCNLLIRKTKAQLITNGEQFLDAMSWGHNRKHERVTKHVLFDQLSEAEKKVLEYLSDDSAHMDMIAMHLHIPVFKMSPLLLSMEMKGLVRTEPGNMYKAT
ncbi:MAG: DNA-processing protein DprA [Bacteroidota bacterium]